jgi:hypothetical protein
MIDELVKKATGGLDGLVNELLRAATDKIKSKFTEAFAIHKIESLKENIARVGAVKTILNPDSIAKLDSIYFEKAITFNKGEKIDSASYFPCKQVLIEGGPGQGKSLYLRWLCLIEGKSSSYIPIFIEFRNLKFKKNLKNELFEAIRDFGVDLDDELFNFLANSDKVLFILDGFDEIPNAARLNVAKELETIARTYPNLRIVVSSRPDSGMGASVYFKKYIIQTLSHECQLEFVNHLYQGGSQAQSINNILTQSSFLTEVTNTPLLLTIFTITYNARQFKPDSLSEFYSLIFPTMLYRHDRLKIGFERERKAGLTDYQMQRIFEALSFVSLKDNNVRFSSPKFRQYLDQATQLEKIAENLEDKLIEDITGITALVIKDGFDDYSFSHKSIQEYFAAVFINRLSDDRKCKFYQLVLINFDEFRKWQNTLEFLSTIDERSYNKYFFLPFKKSVLNLNSSGKVNIDYQSLMQMIGDDTRLIVNENGVIADVYWGDTFLSALYKKYSEFARNVVIVYIRENEKKMANFLSFCDLSDYSKYQHVDGMFVLTLDAFLKGEKLKNSICKRISNEFDSSQFKTDIKNVENELNNLELLTDELLQF